MADQLAGIEVVNGRRCHGMPLACAIQLATARGAAKHECKREGWCIFAPEQGKEYTEGRDSQHVLKAEGASPDATDREHAPMASPDGGPMGVGQAAAAAPAGDTPKPMQGTWTLTAPDGRTWQAESPLRVVAMEQRERIPEKVALDRIFAAASDSAAGAALSRMRIADNEEAQKT